MGTTRGVRSARVTPLRLPCPGATLPAPHLHSSCAQRAMGRGPLIEMCLVGR